jgi:hypothetical protein
MAFWLLVLLGIIVVVIVWRAKGGRVQKILLRGVLLVLALVVAFPFALYFLLGGNPVLDLFAERLYIGDSETQFYRFRDDVFYMKRGNITQDRRYLEGVDTDSFQVLSYDWSKDDQTVYFQYHRTPFNPETFSTIGPCYYSDGQHVFYGGKGSDFILNHDTPLTEKLTVVSEDADNFVYIGIGASGCISSDSNYVYYNADAIESANPGSFHVLNRYWAVDSDSVYVDGKLVDDVSPTGLISVEDSPFAKNDTTVYVARFLQEPLYIDLEADPESFRYEVIKDGNIFWQGIDKDNLYSVTGKKKSL